MKKLATLTALLLLWICSLSACGLFGEKVNWESEPPVGSFPEETETPEPETHETEPVETAEETLPETQAETEPRPEPVFGGAYTFSSLLHQIKYTEQPPLNTEPETGMSSPGSDTPLDRLPRAHEGWLGKEISVDTTDTAGIDTYFAYYPDAGNEGGRLVLLINREQTGVDYRAMVVLDTSYGDCSAWGDCPAVVEGKIVAVHILSVNDTVYIRNLMEGNYSNAASPTGDATACYGAFREAGYKVIPAEAMSSISPWKKTLERFGVEVPLE